MKSDRYLIKTMSKESKSAGMRSVAMAMASFVMMSVLAETGPVFESSDKAFENPIVCNGEIGTGKSFPDVARALDASDAFTVSLWAKVKAFPLQGSTGAKSELGLFSRGWDIRMAISEAVRVQFAFDDPKTGKPRNPILQVGLKNVKAGDWNHYALTYSLPGSNVSVYVNGELCTAMKGAGVLPAKGRGRPLTVGSLPGWYPMNGEIGRVRVWTRALKQDELVASESDAVRELSAELGIEAGSLVDFPTARLRRELSAEDRRLSRGRDLYWATIDPMAVDRTYLPDSKVPEESVGLPLETVCARDEYEYASFIVRSLKPFKSFVPRVKGIPFPVDIRVVKPMWHCHGASTRDIRVLSPLILLHDDALVKVDLEKQHNYLRLDTPTGAVYRCVSEWGDSRLFERHYSCSEWPVHDATDIRPLDLEVGLGRQYWLTVHVPKEGRPGLYRGSVELTSRGRVVGEIPFALRVLPFVLPPAATSYDLSKPYCGAAYYRHNWHRLTDPDEPGSLTSNGRNERQFRAELRNMREHGVLHPTVVMCIALSRWTWNAWRSDRKGGHYTAADPKTLDYLRNVFRIMREEGFPLNPLLIQNTNLGFEHLYKPAEHRATLERIVRECLDFVKDAAGDVETMFYGMDEVSGKTLQAEFGVWKEMRELGAHVFTTTLHEDVFQTVGHVDLLIQSNVPQRKYAQAAHAAGTRLWNYANPQASLKPRAFPYRRNYGFLCHLYGYDGYCTFGVNTAAEHPWNPFDSPVEVDLSFVFGTADGYVDSPAWEGYREAMDDARYETKLRQEIAAVMKGRDAAKREIAEAASAWLEALEPADVDFDPVWARWQVIDWTLKLIK